MKWSWRIGEFAGIGVYIHATFLLLIGWIAVTHLGAGESLAATVAGIIFVLAIFVCVVLHEFGHALTAGRFGIRTRDIVLLPIGGVARLERMPDDPRQELWVAVAGPAVNLAIAGILYLWLAATGSLVPMGGLGVASGPFLERLMAVNLFLVLFNLIPAFPMDGGRVLRALLAMRLEYTRATNIAANIGQVLAFGFGFVGLFTNPFLLFIALFVWIGAAQEASATQMKSALGSIPLRAIMITQYQTLAPHDSLDRAVQLTLAGTQTDFPVTDNGRVVGVLTQKDLLSGLEKGGRGARVADVMRTEFEMAELTEMTERVLMRLQRCNCHTIPVTHDGRLVGLVTMENVGEFVRIHSALRH
jgi:Zn-dependent protease